MKIGHSLSEFRGGMRRQVRDAVYSHACFEIQSAQTDGDLRESSDVVYSVYTFRFLRPSVSNSRWRIAVIEK